MAKRQTKWARRRRDWLFEQLGGECVICRTTKKLELDVIDPVGNTDHHRRMSWDTRMRFYTRQYETSNLQVLCKYHNAQKKDRKAMQPILDLSEHPF